MIDHDMDITAYHGRSDSISKSGLDAMARSPFHYYSLHLNPARPAQPIRGGQLEGNLAHCAALEPEEFGRRYVTVPKDAPRRPSAAQWNAKAPSAESKASMEWWTEWNAKTEGATDVTAAQYDVAMRQAESIRALPELRDMLAKGRAEVSAFWTDPTTGAQCRCRPDFVHQQEEKRVILLDVKTTGDASASDFARTVARKRYHVQDAYYSDGYAAASGHVVGGFVFVAVESEWPYAAATYTLGDDSKAEGFNEYRRLLDLYAECKKANRWPGYGSGVQAIDLPAYAFTPQDIEIGYVENTHG